MKHRGASASEPRSVISGSASRDVAGHVEWSSKLMLELATIRFADHGELSSEVLRKSHATEPARSLEREHRLAGACKEVDSLEVSECENDVVAASRAYDSSPTAGRTRRRRGRLGSTLESVD